jgi:hypothetical protein
MDFKSKIVVGFVLFILIFSTMGLMSFPFVRILNATEYPEINASSSGGIVVDKVYNFSIADPQLEFDNNLLFTKHYYYQIFIEVVSPHACDMDVRIWDPEGALFFITSENNLTQFNSRMIPFGTVMDGNYSAWFTATLPQNMNIHIKIERRDKCLYDEIPVDEQENIQYYNVTKFNDNMNLEFTIECQSDMYYKFYFKRVSTISVELSNYVAIDHDVIDPQDITFQIYRNESLGMLSYYIGTAIEGLYRVEITLYCDVDVVNVVYAVVEKEDISDEIDPNDDDPPPIDPPDNSTGGGIGAFMPFEGTITIIGLVAGAVCMPLILFIYRRKRNTSAL